MRILCRSGHIAFYPRDQREVSDFQSYYKVPLARDGEFYTFPGLVAAPRFSLVASPYLGLPATKTYEGRGPWDVLKANGFVYNLLLGKIVPKASIVTLLQAPQSGYYFVSQTPLIQPGCFTDRGQQVLSYDGEFDMRVLQFNLLEFTYE